ncbi:MAG: HAMP domain-containing sensor histidine kinase [Dehalococcoidales bacterium]
MDSSGEKVKQSEKRINFGDATVHELKTSLTGIIVSAELLAEELQQDGKSLPLRLTQNIIRSAHSLDEKLSNFSEMMGLLAGEFSFQPEDLEVKEVIHSVTTQLFSILQSKKQSIVLELPASLPAARAHRQYLEQILVNLVTNASKFTPEGSRITISAKEDGRNLVVRVTDTGIGITPKEQALVFQPYYQVNGGPGSGLGLAITKFLVELHGGRIWLESAPGQGSSFFFSLPYRPSNEGDL